MAEHVEYAQNHLPGHQEHHHRGCASSKIDHPDHRGTLPWLADNGQLSQAMCAPDRPNVVKHSRKGCKMSAKKLFAASERTAPSVCYRVDFTRMKELTSGI